MITVVVPLLNERDSLAELHGELAEMARAHSLDMEILFVDDGSTDGSWSEIQRLKKADHRVRGLRLRRHFGKSSALAAGFRSARGNFIATIDADLQDDPREIPNLLKALESRNLDLISGWKQTRRDPGPKVFASRVFNWMVSRLTDVNLHDHNCGLKVYRAEVLRELKLYGERHRLICVLAAARGFHVGEQPVHHRPRKHGRSKFGLNRFTRGFLDLLTVKFLTGYGSRPQHLLGGVGLTAFLFGAVSLTYLAITWVVRLFRPEAFEPVHARALLGYAIAGLLFGTQLLSLGLLAELITAQKSPDDDFSVAEEV